MSQSPLNSGVELTQFLAYQRVFGKWDPEAKALLFAAELDKLVEAQYETVLQKRAELLQHVDAAKSVSDVPEFTLEQANTKWKPKEYPKNAALYLQTCLEMTGNALNRMGINAFNYINKINKDNFQKPKMTWMCCGEDANGAQFSSVIENIHNLREIVAGTANINFKGKTYKIEVPAQLPPFSYRPRGLHCIDASVLRTYEKTQTKEPIVGACLDLALWASFVLPEILKRKACPLLYIPKMQVVEEARLYHTLLKYIEKRANIPEGTIKVVFLAETFPIVFVLPSMIEAFEGRCIGCNCGRWDYLFSYQNVVSSHLSLDIDGNEAKCSLPPKHLVTTSVDFLKKYQIHVAQVCHKYGIQFIGGMNAQLPSNHADIKIRDAENKKILEATLQNKVHEKVFYGASRTWVAHIGLLGIAHDLAKTQHEKPIDKNIKAINVSRYELTNAPADKYTQADLSHDLLVILLYMSQYLITRNGAIAISGLMEDLATAEISCTLVWYHLKHKLLPGVSIDALLDTVAQKVLDNHVLPSLGEASKVAGVRKAHATRIVQLVKRVVSYLLQNANTRPSLEKSLYVLSTIADSEQLSFLALKYSKRFDEHAELARVINQIVAEEAAITQSKL